ncbi:MAG: hypothetical protein AAGJ82_11830 [Bacteroidota bacterium]
MNTTEQLTAIRQLITEAKNDKAAEQLLAFLQNQPPRLRAWQDQVRNLRAQYQRAQQGKRLSTVSYDDTQRAINKVTQGLLQVVQKIERGEGPQQSATGNKKSWLIAGILLAVGIAVTAFFFLRKADNTPLPDTVQDDITVVNGETEGKCPIYPVASPFNIMILPFLPLDGVTKDIETALRIRLASKMEEYGVEGSVFTQMIDVRSPQYPVTGEMASALGEPCDAQLVIWGTTEKAAESEDLITTTKFRFVENDNFRLTDLVLNIGTTIDTVSSLSSIATTAELTDNIEQSLRLVFGLMAHETGNHAVAARVLDTLVESLGGAAKVPKWGLIQADSYIRSGQEERALEIYREIAEKDTANVQALLNKSALEWRQGNAQVALNDLNRTLSQEPNNRRARQSRASVHVAQHEVAKAKPDLKILQETEDVDSDRVSKLAEQLATVEAEEEAKYAAAEQQLATNPNDTSALRIKAVTASRLGHFVVAERAAEQLLQIAPGQHRVLQDVRIQQVRPLLIDSMRLPRPD